MRPENGEPLFIPTGHAELVAARERIVEMDRILKREREVRGRLAERANAEIAGLKQQLAEAVPEEEVQGLKTARAGNRLVVPMIGLAALAALVGFCVWYADPMHTWDRHLPASPPAVRVARAPNEMPAVAAGSAETHALSRLNDAVSDIPASAMPSVLHAANDLLGESGEQACSVDSRSGGVSLVVSGRGSDEPLLAALSRCARAVEHFTKPTGEQ